MTEKVCPAGQIWMLIAQLILH